MQDRSQDGPDRRGIDPDRVAERERPDDDPGAVEDRRQGVPEVAQIGEQDLAERQRRREEDLRHQHDPEEVEVERPLRAGEARCDDLGRPLGEDEEQDRTDAHDHDAEREHGPGEAIGIGDAVLRRPEAREDRDEGRREPCLDEDVEQQLRQLERGVVRVELRAGAERAGQHALAKQADDVASEEQRRDDERAGRQVAAREVGQSPLHRRGTALITTPRYVGGVRRGRPGRNREPMGTRP